MSAVVNSVSIKSYSKDSTPDELHRLASNSNFAVRLAVAEDGKTSARTLALLAETETVVNEIHVALAGNSQTDAETLEVLYRKAGGSRVKNFLKFLVSPYDGITLEPAKENVLLVLCRNSHIPVEVLRKLSRFHVSAVRLEATYNPNLPEDIKADVLCRIIADRRNGGHAENYALTAIEHPCLPDYVRRNAINQILAEGYTDTWRHLSALESLSNHQVDTLASSDDADSIAILCANTALSAEAYTALAGRAGKAPLDILRSNPSASFLFPVEGNVDRSANEADTLSSSSPKGEKRSFFGWFNRG